MPRSSADWARIVTAMRAKADSIEADFPGEAANFRAQAKELEAKHCPPATKPPAARAWDGFSQNKTHMDDIWRMAGGGYTRDGFNVWLQTMTDETDYYEGIPDDTD